ncbi:MAG TPA: hypothetical protein VFP19_02375, partial [Candidatus Limnocylindrales bacterium]|nr:hypothetical protein [Candidatus Limnocylindrales bacterium]
RYNIEQDWDYAYLTVNGDPIPTNLSTNTSPNGQNFGEGITGVQNTWTSLTADLSAFAGQTVTIGFEYWTDGAQQGTPGQTSAPGFQVDAIDISGQAFDGAESAAGWAYAPATGPAFHVTTGSETRQYSNYYFAEYRQYRGYDKALEVSPYNFGWLNDATKQNFVEFFPYQDGLLVWYWDNSYADNNVGDHPGGGLILPVDAHPAMEHWSDISGAGSVMRPRIQAYDSTFGFWPTDAITLHHNGNETTIASKPAVLVFNDLNDYYVSSDPGDASGGGRYQSSWSSVQTPHTGTTIRVVSLGAQGSFLQVNVNS